MLTEAIEGENILFEDESQLEKLRSSSGLQTSYNQIAQAPYLVEAPNRDSVANAINVLMLQPRGMLKLLLNQCV